MAKKTLQSCKTAQDYVKYAEKNGGEVKYCKNGIVKVYGGSKERYAVIHASHTKELATGTSNALTKAFLAIGITGTAICALSYFLIQV